MFETGQKIGPYILERPLGEGSYGVVWLAEERTGLIQRQIALKLPKDADPDIDAVRREAEVWLRAGKHHNVVQVLHADIYDGQVAIATEYISGGSLHDRLKGEAGKTADVAFAVEMTRGILAGLQHLHSVPPRPLVHRDLKPGNVLLRGDTPLLTDFGLSRAFSSTAFTQAGGTPGYMPPEAFDDRFSPQTDIWAAGVTLYRMLKGELPFPQRDLSALIGAILNKEPEPLPAWVPGPVAAVIFRALMKDPDRRYASAEEMRTALDAALQDSTAGVATPSTRLAPIPPLPYSAPSIFDFTVQASSPAANFGLPPSHTIAAPDRLMPQPGANVPQVPALETRTGNSRALEIVTAYHGAGTALEERRANQDPDWPKPESPHAKEIAEWERRGLAHAEALTAVAEPPAQSRGLTRGIDDLLRYLSGDTARYCGALIAAVPIWGVLGVISRILERTHLLEGVAGLLLTAGIMSVLFARLAWHRYYWLPEVKRRSAAMRYAVLGLFSGTIVPVIVVTFIVAITGATSAPSETPDPDTTTPKIEPPSPELRPPHR